MSDGSLKTYRSDLHIHSVLSPCGSLSISPKAIVKRALELGLDLIALTDHNSVGNCEVLETCVEEEGERLEAFYGLEVQTREEVHVICLFDNIHRAKEFGRTVREKLLPKKNDADYFGEQLKVDEDDEIIGREERLLSNSLTIGLTELCEGASRLGGVVFPSHVFRGGFGLIAQLGFIPSDLLEYVDAAEISVRNWSGESFENSELLMGLTEVSFSDAHKLNQMGSGVTALRMKKPSTEELKAAFRGERGRKVEGVSVDKS